MKLDESVKLQIQIHKLMIDKYNKYLSKNNDEDTSEKLKKELKEFNDLRIKYPEYTL